ncbi:MAG: UDP-3-O-acyl-N-acetylglucosamine deacetylase [Armatimonadota bacterium]|nr:UDP-3-O-acyl-N-acetylglucosamine deacetylase [Armatimonadota bacterium]MDR7437525.1 UDP-3-O-acyl-N-acetylglucosamine deacetylase [Armatimonadota bacterium]MDR7507784.1 UDP-3-O-acyl-N-acetylglucosamine deacetylase [Armatimonadota bacterium]MDR7516807.1 UDP-3-O-acyl-N-acetylglucosamine deacetylase [Armatimonadota bacterium]MDR7581816.1 UDP-3-O-acyl-N-acetylglucosamine deacetylase [Armatimonadota bacterium]
MPVSDPNAPACHRPGVSSMWHPTQRTVARPVDLSGVGIHTGQAVRLRLHPAPPGTGVVFRRVDASAEAIPVRPHAVSDAHRGVTLGRGVTVRTVEHLLAAAAGVGVANLLVELDGPELPILDGSAAPFVSALREAGVVDQGAPWPSVAVSDPVWVGGEGAWVLVLPAPRFRATYAVVLREPLGVQVVDFDPQAADFAAEIAPARTWGYADDLPELHAAGLGRGVAADNVLALGPAGYLTPPRWADEPARHKVVDLIGDLALLGRPLRAHVIACGAGHALHVEAARRLWEQMTPQSARSTPSP